MDKFELWDPVFSVKNIKAEETAKALETRAAHDLEINAGSSDDVFVRVMCGGVNGPQIPAMVNRKDRLVLPVRRDR